MTGKLCFQLFGELKPLPLRLSDALLERGMLSDSISSAFLLHVEVGVGHQLQELFQTGVIARELSIQLVNAAAQVLRSCMRPLRFGSPLRG